MPMSDDSEQIFMEDCCSSFTGDRLEVTWHGGIANFEIENPWAGSTETGFGYTTDCSLNREQVLRLAHWLMKMAEQR